MEPSQDLRYRFPFEDQQGWRSCLKELGFVVIAEWLPRVACQNQVNRLWDVMEHLADGRLDRNKPETQQLSKNYPPVLHGGMIQYVGHSQAQWDLRKHAKPLFAKLWKTENLSSSYDGFCFMNGRRRYRPSPIDSFLHCDQSPTRKGIWSIQGVLTLTDSGQDEGGFVCVPASHLKHQEYFMKKSMLDYRKDWFLVPEEDKTTQVLGQCLKVDSKAGDFILWDSRTFHCNTVPRKEVLRICVYICMIPQDRIPQKRKNDRKIGAQEKRVSTHHPGDGFKLFPVLPRFVTNRENFMKLVNDVNTFEMDAEIEKMI